MTKGLSLNFVLQPDRHGRNCAEEVTRQWAIQNSKPEEGLYCKPKYRAKICFFFKTNIFQLF